MDAIAKTKTVKRLTEADLLSKGHTHIVTGTLRMDPVSNKQKVTIQTRDANGNFDGNTREIATSDLHQCFTTEATKEAMDRAKRNGKAKAKRAARKDQEPVVILDETPAAPVATGAEALAAAIG